MRPTLPCRIRLRKTVTRVPSSRPSERNTSPPHQKPLWAAYYRGGTSRAVLLQPQELPSNQGKWRGMFRQVVQAVVSGELWGRQLGGIETGASSLGKICLVEPYHKSEEHVVSQSDASAPGGTALESSKEPHIDYTFISMDAKNGHVDITANCGNMTSAIGPYAYNARLLSPDIYAIKDGEVTVTIRNTNTMKIVESTFSVSGGQAAVTGDYVADGVHGKGSKISLDFIDPNRSTTNNVFPTGKYMDVVELLPMDNADAVKKYKVTCVDGATPVVFIRADAIGIPGTILPHELNARKDILDLLENIRKTAAVAMGIADTKKAVPRTIPKIAIVSQSSQHQILSGAALKASQMDLVVRFISDSQPHSAIPLTGALTTAVAARMPGTIVEQLLTPDAVVPGVTTIGHASGRLQVKLELDKQSDPPVWVGTVSTTAKRLFEGKLFWTDASKDADSTLSAQTPRHSLGLAFINDLRVRDSPEARLLTLLKDEHAPFTPPPSPQSPTLENTNPLLDSLSHLRTSLKYFEALYPSKSKPHPARIPEPTPSNIAHHLAGITRHINVLTASLETISKNKEDGGPTPETGRMWHRWAQGKTWGRKSDREKWMDGELNTLSRRGRFVWMGKGRRKLLRRGDLAEDELRGMMGKERV